jgi:hypothetical protein
MVEVAFFAGAIGALGGAIAGDENERQEPKAERLRVQLRLIAGDDPAVLELADALEDGRGRQAHPPRDLRLGRAGVVAEDGEDFAIDGVDHSSTSGIGRRYDYE